MASLSTCHLGLWLGWQILLNLVKSLADLPFSVGVLPQQRGNTPTYIMLILIECNFLFRSIFSNKLCYLLLFNFLLKVGVFPRPTLHVTISRRRRVEDTKTQSCSDVYARPYPIHESGTRIFAIVRAPGSPTQLPVASVRANYDATRL